MTPESTAGERVRPLTIAVEKTGVDSVLDGGGYAQREPGVLVCEGVEEWDVQRKHLVNDRAESPDIDVMRVRVRVGSCSELAW